MWQVTGYTWQVTHDTGLEDIWTEGSLNKSFNELMNDGGDLTTATATPGLSKKGRHYSLKPIQAYGQTLLLSKADN